jgi:hypothetical protein
MAGPLSTIPNWWGSLGRAAEQDRMWRTCYIAQKLENCLVFLAF